MNNWWGASIIHMFNDMYPGVPNIGAVALCAWLIIIVVSIVLHELAHGWVAIRCGDDTPRLLGHMTLDPIKHMGIISLVLLAVVGVAWGAMPVNPAIFRRRFDDALVSVAGPLMNVAIALVFIVLAIVGVLVLEGNAESYVKVVCNIGSIMNLTLAALNMLPIPPLDGSRIAASFIPQIRPWVYSPHGAIIGMLVFLIASRTFGIYFLLFSSVVCLGAEEIVLALLGYK